MQISTIEMRAINILSSKGENNWYQRINIKQDIIKEKEMIKVVVRTLLDPKIDFVFKKIFGAENNKRVLIDFLNAVINDKDPIVEVELKNTDMEKEF